MILAEQDAHIATLEAQLRASPEQAAAPDDSVRATGDRSTDGLLRTEVELLNRLVSTAEEAAAVIGRRND